MTRYAGAPPIPHPKPNSSSPSNRPIRGNQFWIGTQIQPQSSPRREVVIIPRKLHRPASKVQFLRIISRTRQVRHRGAITSGARGGVRCGAIWIGARSSTISVPRRLAVERACGPWLGSVSVGGWVALGYFTRIYIGLALMQGVADEGGDFLSLVQFGTGHEDFIGWIGRVPIRHSSAKSGI